MSYYKSNMLIFCRQAQRKIDYLAAEVHTLTHQLSDMRDFARLQKKCPSPAMSEHLSASTGGFHQVCLLICWFILTEVNQTSSTSAKPTCPVCPDCPLAPHGGQELVQKTTRVTPPPLPSINRAINASLSLNDPFPPIFSSNIPPTLEISSAYDYIALHHRLSKKTTRICLVTSAISGPTLNGGVATAFYSLAKHLANSRSASGAPEFKVTVLYAAHPYYSSGNGNDWVRRFKAESIEFVPLPETDIDFYGHKYVIRAYRIFEWLRDRENEFDVISYHDYMANGYYVALAKHQKLYFHNTFIFVQCHSTIRWADMLNYRPPKDHNTLGYYYMEQKSIEYADARVSPSQYYLEWMEGVGNYNLSQGYSFVVQNTLFPLKSDTQVISLHQTRHFVFFARLEVRKGLMVFMDALDILCATESTTPSDVSFIGPDVVIDGSQASDLIRSRAKEKHWPFKLHIDHTLNTERALKYIKDQGAVTVLPTLGDNSPYAVMEIVAYDLPMITTDAGGGLELFIDDAEQSVVVPERDAQALAQVMMTAILTGIRNVKMSSTFSETKNLYLELIKSFHHAVASSDQKSSKHGFEPTQSVTVGITTFNRADSVFDCIQSIANQDYPRDRLHVVIVDDASTDADVAIALRKSSEILHQKSISHEIVRLESHQFVATTRNRIFELAEQRSDDFICLLVCCSWCSLWLS
jgi:glycosyltransferase involved in cell wall biosynthesis